MFFKTKKELEQIARERDEYKESSNDYLNQLKIKIDHQQYLEREIKNYKNKIKILEEELEQLSQKYKIMEKYFNLNEPLSENVQAKLLADLRLHDMEYKSLQDSINKMQQLLIMSNQPPVTILPPLSYYKW